ncbi:zinc-binding dehydrogenase [Streptomyces sp. NPDC059556]|uniref:zinc-binding dehydrogenase n=1 Tax=Streptomyces sp. NPDC059556 TaxID=3346863 RepID=UPI0036B394A9
MAGPLQRRAAGRAGGLIDAGRLRVGIDGVFPLSAAPQAHARAERGHLQGKIVLRVVD